MSDRKAYMVIFQDEWDNLELIGTYGILSDPELIETLNALLPKKFRIEPGMIREYASTWGTCFDISIVEMFDGTDGITEQDLEEVYGYSIRGFVLYSNEAEALAATLMDIVEDGGDEDDRY